MPTSTTKNLFIWRHWSPSYITLCANRRRYDSWRHHLIDSTRSTFRK